MASKAACIVYIEEFAGSVDAVEARLHELDYDVQSFEISKDRATAVRAGELESMPPELRTCLEAADLCVLLLGDDAECLGAIGGLGSDLGCRVVTIGGSPENVPSELDDIADGHLPDVDQPAADEVLGGTRSRIKTDGEPAEERKAKRQKCQ